jgi:hypothetical protein
MLTNLCFSFLVWWSKPLRFVARGITIVFTFLIEMGLLGVVPTATAELFSVFLSQKAIWPLNCFFHQAVFLPIIWNFTQIKWDCNMLQFSKPVEEYNPFPSKKDKYVSPDTQVMLLWEDTIKLIGFIVVI